jgi:energy-coupling factor transporter transmembrane protein EcfT
MSRAATKPRRRRRQLADLHVLRYVPGSGPLHRAWAGSKIVSLALVSVALVFWPSWGASGLAGSVLLVGFLAARLPRGVLPRLPRWVILVLLLGAVLALTSGTKPYVSLAGLRVGLGGLNLWAEFWVLGIEILALAALLAWTTPLSDLAPALGRLFSPFRRLHLPIDEVVATIALGIRCLPLLIEEVRVLTAARRTRRPEPLRGAKEISGAIEETMFTALSSALRRAGELAEAMEARGGVAAPPPETHRLARVDWAILGLALGVLAATVAIS